MAHVFVKTWGCTANHDNSAIIAGLLLQHGHELVTTNDDADVLIYNTCTVKGTTENKISHDIKNALITCPEKKIIITGCMASAQTALLRDLAPGASIVSVQNLTALPTALETILEGEIVTITQRSREVKLGFPKQPRNDHVAVIQIAEGCADTCTFCITKLAKGHIFSFPQDQIIAAATKAIQEGATLIYLTSQDNGAYGLDQGSRSHLATLLNALLALNGDFLIRLGMTNPRHIIPILDELIAAYTHQKMLPFLHIPLQSGSENVLHAMNRKHSVADFVNIVTRFRAAIPTLCIATDIICGYPTETEEDFQQTLTLLHELQPGIVNISKFTPRPGTRAATLKPHTSQELKRRSTLTYDLFKTYRKELTVPIPDRIVLLPH